MSGHSLYEMFDPWELAQGLAALNLALCCHLGVAGCTVMETVELRPVVSRLYGRSMLKAVGPASHSLAPPAIGIGCCRYMQKTSLDRIFKRQAEDAQGALATN